MPSKKLRSLLSLRAGDLVKIKIEPKDFDPYEDTDHFIGVTPRWIRAVATRVQRDLGMVEFFAFDKVHTGTFYDGHGLSVGDSRVDIVRRLSR